jgi:enoyl-CoA hydratase/carnithine racemase
MIPHTPFDEYREIFAPYIALSRSETGVMTAQMHTDGGPVVWAPGVHRAVHQLTTVVGQDPDTEVFIFGGTGNHFIGTVDEELTKATSADLAPVIYENFYYDGTRICEGLVNNLEVPTIGVLNGPGFHTELALFCDITIAAEDATIVDPHLLINLVPGDGIQIALRTAMGLKRANYAMLMSELIDAQTALKYGLVNEVVPRDEVYDRAREIGEMLAQKPRTVRRVTSQVLRGPLKEALARDLRGGMGQELFALLATSGPDASKVEGIWNA